jgi:hypothetical protein
MENHRMLGTAEAVVGGTEGGPGPTGVPTTTAAAVGGGGQPFRVPLISCRKKRHRPHQPPIGS